MSRVQVMSRRNAFDNTLGLGGGLQVTVLVRETNDAAAVGSGIDIKRGCAV